MHGIPSGKQQAYKFRCASLVFIRFAIMHVAKLCTMACSLEHCQQRHGMACSVA